MSTLKLLPLGNALCRRLSIRHLSSSGAVLDARDFPEHRALMIDKFGDPVSNVYLKTSKPEQVLPKELGSDQILIEHLAATVNPADINIVQGVYGNRPELPAILGNEGVARVKRAGNLVKHLKEGDLVVGVTMPSSWQSYSVQKSDGFFSLNPKLVDIQTAAQIKVNPCTAFRMLKDFIELKPGDTIIQNGANSAVGVYAIQLAKLWGFNTINVIRDRPNKDEVISELKDFGATYTITEEEVGSVESMKPILSNISKPKLFLNCVGGKNAMNCQRHLGYSGVSVTYGAMSRQPFSVPASPLIFKDHKFVGFWVSRWFNDKLRSHQREHVESMFEDLCQMFISGTLKPKASTMISFEDRNVAFDGSSNNRKFIFDINK